jgi:hypothetical protein
MALLLGLAAGCGRSPKMSASLVRDDEALVRQAFTLDALITSGRTAPVELLMPLYHQLPAQVTILMVRLGPAASQQWANLLGETSVGVAEWYALANASLSVRAPAFASYLVWRLPKKVRLELVDHVMHREMGGRGNSTGIGPTGALRPTYQLAHDKTALESPWVRFSVGPENVFYRRSMADHESNCQRVGGPAYAAVHYLEQLGAFDEDELLSLAFDQETRLRDPARDPAAELRQRRTALWRTVIRKLVSLRLLDPSTPTPDIEIEVVNGPRTPWRHAR